MIARFEHHTVDAIFVEFKDSRCPANAVTFSNRQNNALDGFPAVVGVHKDGVTILRKPLITGPAAKQMSFIFPIASTGCDVSFSPHSMVLALRIWAEIVRKIYHPVLLS